MQLLVLSDARDGGASVLPALEHLDHPQQYQGLDPETLDVAGPCDAIVVDATQNLGAASRCSRAAALSDRNCPVVVVITEAGLAALKASWGFDDWMLPHAGVAEVETRLRIAVDRVNLADHRPASNIGELHIDEETYIVRLRGAPLDLTYREFTLLNHLASNPGRVFTREQLLSEVWGYDYYGGTRTVDVHIRRLRAKLGAEHESLIATVWGVGYKLDPAAGTSSA